MHDSLWSKGEATHCSERSWEVTAPPPQSFLILFTHIMSMHVCKRLVKMTGKVSWMNEHLFLEEGCCVVSQADTPAQKDAARQWGTGTGGWQ